MDLYERLLENCAGIRSQNPVVHNITNYVAMNFTANVLLAVGARPLMSFCSEEIEEVVKISKALVVNIGCIDHQLISASRIAVRAAAENGIPWVLDPVGVGVSSLRRNFSLEIIRLGRPAVIKGNVSEICNLSSCEDAEQGADRLASEYGCVVAVSGPVDYVTDGFRRERINAGDSIMTRVTATGCALAAVTGAFLTVEKDAFVAAHNALLLMAQSGQKAAAVSNGRTGTFAVEFLDVLSTFAL